MADLLRACDKSVATSQKDVEVKGYIIDNQQKQLDLSAKRISELEGKSGGILDNKTFWFITGMLVTGLTVNWVRR